MRALRLVTGLMGYVGGGIALGQDLPIQQPIGRQFSVGTTVSVPDRGEAFLGGVSRAGESRRSFGPFRNGSSVGMFRDHAGLSAQVWIHDLREMDRAILNSVPAGSPSTPDSFGLSPQARHAHATLLAKRVPEPRGPTTSRSEDVDKADKAAFFLRLGREAEQRGNAGVARLHYRMAQKYGAVIASP